MSHIIGVDIGTSSIKIGKMDKNFNLDTMNKQAYSLVYPKNGWMEIDVHEVWNKTQQMIYEAIHNIRINGGEVDAISLSTFCNSSVLMDMHGNALSNGIMYLDSRSKEQAERIYHMIGEELLYKITRNRVEPGMYTVTSILWKMENQLDLFRQTYKWGNLSTFIHHKLTGNFVMDWTQASYTGIFDVLQYQWSTDICDKLGIDMSILPDVVSPFDDIGEFEKIPVIAGAADTASSGLALDLKPDEMFESVGTSNVLTVCTNQPEQLDTRFLNRCFVWPNQWLSHGAMSTPGASIKWFSHTFLEEKENEKTDILEYLPEQSEIGANGVFFLPYMQGERSPIWDHNARGVFAGMHLQTSKADMLRAILEGSAFGLRQIYEIIESSYCLHAQRFRSIGGGANNKVWAQIKANILKTEIDIQQIAETGVYGSCLIAGKTIGYFTNMQDIAPYIQNKTMYTVKPDMNTFQTYDRYYKKFITLYPMLKDFFQVVE
ncbi:xylulokinase [Oceanobacillus jeddahense]|uniref:xylulokinase n=1 Tax=Oceanobacillus jeddahense TaxID=1462527 RepID=UPI0005962892|nr:FGGY family carbohydrate kinase [Oceanobacillus jeddahense]